MIGDNRDKDEAVQDQLRTLIRRAGELVDGLDEDTFNRRPAGGGWSAGECLDHLNETALLYLPAFTETVERARREGRVRQGNRDRSLFGRLIVWSQEPPVRFRMKTFDALRPRGDLEPAAVLERFEALHEELIVRVNEASDLDWRRVKLRSLLDRRLRLCLGDWFHFMAAHGRRHLWQAERVLAEVDPRDGDGPE